MLRKVCLASPLYMIVRTICEGASVNYSLRGHEIGGVRLIRWRVTTSGGGGSPLVTTHSAIYPTLTNKFQAISHSKPSSNNWELSSPFERGLVAKSDKEYASLRNIVSKKQQKNWNKVLEIVWSDFSFANLTPAEWHEWWIGCSEQCCRWNANFCGACLANKHWLIWSTLISWIEVFTRHDFLKSSWIQSKFDGLKPYPIKPSQVSIAAMHSLMQKVLQYKQFTI